MSDKPCGCGNVRSNEGTQADANDVIKPQIVPLPPELRERHRAQRAAYQAQLPDYLAEALVSLPESAELPNHEGL